MFYLHVSNNNFCKYFHVTTQYQHCNFSSDKHVKHN